MPYIKQKDRGDLSGDYQIRGAETPGELNYCFTQEITGYIINKSLSYQTINDIVGALEGAKLEFYRRIAVPYEDQKIKENGDIYV